MSGAVPQPSGLLWNVSYPLAVADSVNYPPLQSDYHLQTGASYHGCDYRF